MNKISIHNKLFIVFFVLLMVFVIWKVPHENNGSSKNQTEKPSLQ